MKLGWIAVGGPDRARRRRARAARARLRHLSRRSRRPCSSRRPSCSRAAPPSARRSRRASPPTTARCTAAVAGAPACRVLPREGGWYAVLQVPSLEPEEDLVAATCWRRRRAGASRILLRLSRASRFWSSACCRRSRRSPTASRASCGTSTCTASRHERLDRPPPRGPAHPAVLVPVHRELGHRRHRRPRAARPRGWPAPASGSCSCCRSTRWRRASSRRTRRSARWRSIRSSSACRACRSSRRSAARRRSTPSDRDALAAVRRVAARRVSRASGG